MKKTFKQFLFIAFFLAILIVPCLIFVQNGSAATTPGIMDNLKNTSNNAGYDASTNELSLATIAGTAVKAILSLLGVIFVILIIYAGILWMTAGGDESKVEKAGTIMKNSIVGLIITVSALTIYTFINTKFLQK